MPLIFEKSRVDAVALNIKEFSLYVGQSKDMIDANVVGREIEVSSPMFVKISKLSCENQRALMSCFLFV